MVGYGSTLSESFHTIIVSISTSEAIFLAPSIPYERIIRSCLPLTHNQNHYTWPCQDWKNFACNRFRNKKKKKSKNTRKKKEPDPRSHSWFVESTQNSDLNYTCTLQNKDLIKIRWCLAYNSRSLSSLIFRYRFLLVRITRYLTRSDNINSENKKKYNKQFRFNVSKQNDMYMYIYI